MNTLFAFLAGLLTTLSPCVLPVLPFVTASSFNKNKAGPLFLALGLLVSFVSVSLIISSSGLFLGFEPSTVKVVSGFLLFLSGILFFSQKISDWFAVKMSFLTRYASTSNAENKNQSVLIELVNGLLLGVVWTPCSGPSLGAAMALAAQANGVYDSFFILMFFGLGAVLPILAYAYGARHVIVKMKGHSGTISRLKKVFGVLIMIFGLLIVFKLDRKLESAVNNLLPESWLSFITQY